MDHVLERVELKADLGIDRRAGFLRRGEPGVQSVDLPLRLQGCDVPDPAETTCKGWWKKGRRTLNMLKAISVTSCWLAPWPVQLHAGGRGLTCPGPQVQARAGR